MEHKTKVNAEDGQLDIHITRDFDLPLDLLFKAYEDRNLFEEWMGTRILKWACESHGYFAFETSHDGQVVFRANGTFHDVVPLKKIIRTFDMEDPRIPAQLEFLEFESTGEDTSRLIIHMIFRTVEARNELLKRPFAWGLSMAHDRLQEIVQNKQ